MLANRKYTDLMMQYHQATEELQSIRSNKQQFQQQKEEEIEKLRQMLDAYQTNTHADQWELEQSRRGGKILAGVLCQAEC